MKSSSFLFFIIIIQSLFSCHFKEKANDSKEKIFDSSINNISNKNTSINHSTFKNIAGYIYCYEKLNSWINKFTNQNKISDVGPHNFKVSELKKLYNSPNIIGILFCNIKDNKGDGIVAYGVDDKGYLLLDDFVIESGRTLNGKLVIQLQTDYMDAYPKSNAGEFFSSDILQKFISNDIYSPIEHINIEKGIDEKVERLIITDSDLLEPNIALVKGIIYSSNLTKIF